jgi:NADH dehydrogenase FAD-containing subunit
VTNVAAAPAASALLAAAAVAASSSNQVVGHERIFAAGDCMACPFERTAVSAKLSATLAATNIARHARGQALLRYPQDVCFGAAAPPSIQGISLGPFDGLLELQGRVVLTGRPVAFIKARIEATQFMSLKRPTAAWALYYQERAMVWSLTAGLRYVQLLLRVLQRAWRALCCGGARLAAHSNSARPNGLAKEAAQVACKGE